jgi:signal transduction histidine kinase
MSQTTFLHREWPKTREIPPSRTFGRLFFRPRRGCFPRAATSTERLVKHPLRRQILGPVAGLVLLAVAINMACAAWWTWRADSQAADARQAQIVTVLAQANFPLTTPVLEKLHSLTGDDYLVFDRAARRIIASTIGADGEPDAGLLADRTVTIELSGTAYRARTHRLPASEHQVVAVLTPQARVWQQSVQALWLPLAAGVSSLALVLPLLARLAYRLGTRIRLVQQHVEGIARGEFPTATPPGTKDDELARLVTSVGELSRQLGSYREELARSERARLLGQLTAGFAHQLRNGLAGAKLALQLHQRRCAQPTQDASLSNALLQLNLVEDEVRGLLSLGRESDGVAVDVDLCRVMGDVQRLVQPACEHHHIRLECELPPLAMPVRGQAERLRSACLNLALNAIDAAGPEGCVSLCLQAEGDEAVVAVSDSGPGPQPEIADRLFDSFVTTKPEGIGLGLTVAQRVVQEHGGSLTWCRRDGRTRFEIRLPAGGVKDNA